MQIELANTNSFGLLVLALVILICTYISAKKIKVYLEKNNIPIPFLKLVILILVGTIISIEIPSLIFKRANLWLTLLSYGVSGSIVSIVLGSLVFKKNKLKLSIILLPALLGPIIIFYLIIMMLYVSSFFAV